MSENLDEILKELFQSIEKDKHERLKIKVGDMDSDIINKFNEFKRNSRKLRDDVELAQKALELEYKRKMEEIIEPMFHEVAEVHHNFWSQVYEKYNLDKNKEFTINNKEKVIYQYIE